MSVKNDRRANLSEKTAAVTVEVPPAIVDEVADRVEATGVEPTDAAICDLVFDQVELSPEFRVGDRSLAAAVRDQVEGGD